MNDTLPTHDSMMSLLANHQHIHENIKFADQKAVILITINSGLLSIIFSIFNEKSFLISFGIIVCVVLILAIGFAVYVIWPRRGWIFRKYQKLGPGVVDPDRIRRYSVDEYTLACAQITDEDLLKQLREFVYVRSTVNSRKYRFLEIAIYISTIGWVGGLSFIILQQLCS